MNSNILFDLGIEGGCYGGCTDCAQGRSGRKILQPIHIQQNTWDAIHGVLGLAEYAGRPIALGMEGINEYHWGSLEALTKMKITQAMLGNDGVSETTYADLKVFVQSFFPQLETIQLNIRQRILSVEDSLRQIHPLLRIGLPLAEELQKNIVIAVGINDIANEVKYPDVRQMFIDFHKGLEKSQSVNGTTCNVPIQQEGHKVGELLKGNNLSREGWSGDIKDGNLEQSFKNRSGRKIIIATNMRTGSEDKTSDIITDLERQIREQDDDPNIGWFGQRQVNPVHTLRRPKTGSTQAWMLYDTFGGILRLAEKIGYKQALLNYFKSL